MIPTAIPSNTHLFSVFFEVLVTADDGPHELSMKDEFYRTHDRTRGLDFVYTYKPQGYTDMECYGGTFTVL